MDYDGVTLGVPVIISPPHVLLLTPLVLPPFLLKGAGNHDGLLAPDHQVGVLTLQGHEGHVAPRAVLAVLHGGGAKAASHTHTHTIQLFFTHYCCTCGYREADAGNETIISFVSQTNFNHVRNQEEHSTR